VPWVEALSLKKNQNKKKTKKKSSQISYTADQQKRRIQNTKQSARPLKGAILMIGLATGHRRRPNAEYTPNSSANGKFL